MFDIYIYIYILLLVLLDIAVKVDFLGHWHLPPDVVIPGKHPSEIVPKYSERKGMIQKKQINTDHRWS